MSRLSITTKNQAQMTVETLYKDLERRIDASQPGLCPVDLAASFLHLCHAHHESVALIQESLYPFIWNKISNRSCKYRKYRGKNDSLPFFYAIPSVDYAEGKKKIIEKQANYCHNKTNHNKQRLIEKKKVFNKIIMNKIKMIKKTL